MLVLSRSNLYYIKKNNPIPIENIHKRKEYPQIRTSDGTNVISGSIFRVNKLHSTNEYMKIFHHNGYAIVTSYVLMNSNILTNSGVKKASQLSVGDMIASNGIEIYKDFQWVYDEHFIKRRSIKEISNECNIDESIISHIIRKHGYQSPHGETNQVMTIKIRYSPINKIEISKKQIDQYDIIFGISKYIVVDRILFCQ